jgi:hypothetical protein
MSERQKTLQIKDLNKDYQVTLDYDQCKSGESQYGPWYLYGIEHDGKTMGIFAEIELHKQLKKFGKGARLIIRRNQSDGKLKWQVTSANGNSQTKPKQTVIGYLDDRTRDIHAQVSLKIAVTSFGNSTKPSTSEDLQEIRSRKNMLLELLDGPNEDDLPF